MRPIRPRRSTWLAAAAASLSLCGWTVVWAGDQPDFSKLKPGDKVEVKVGPEWKSAEFVAKVSDAFITVRGGNSPRPYNVLANSVRIPKGRAKAVQPRDPNDPFATDEEKSVAGAMRTWTDRGGKFQVEAKMLRIDGDKVVLRRADDKEISVPLEKFIEVDQKYVADVKAGKIKLSAAAPKGKVEENEEESETEQSIPLTATDLDSARLIEPSPNTPWKYEPDIAPLPTPLPSARVALQPASDIFEKATRVLFLPSEKKAFVVFVNSAPGRQGLLTRLQACDLGQAKLDGVGVFGVGVEPLDISPDGAFVLARSDGLGFGAKGELRIYAREGKKAKPVSAWLPYGHHTTGAPSQGDRPSLGPDADVTWASYLDSKHVITISTGGELAVWEMPKIRPIYVVRAERGTIPCLTPNRKYVVFATSAGVAILNALTGAAAGVLPADISGFSWHSFALRGDGQRLALQQNGRMRVWDLNSQELTRDFPIGRSIPSDDLTWIGDNQLLIEGGVVVDVEHRIPIWRFTGLGTTWQVRGEKLWFLGRGLTQNKLLLCSAPLTKKTVPDPLVGVAADSLLVIKPGLEISLELSLPGGADAEKTRQEVIERLKQNGVTIVPQSKIKLLGAITQGSSQTLNYQARGMGRLRGAPVASYQFTPQILTLSYQVDNDTVWKFESQTTPPHLLRSTKEQTSEQALQKASQQDVRTFGRIWIPAFVARPPANLAQNASEAPVSGG